MNTRLEIQAFAKPLVLVKRPIPSPPPGGAIVKVLYTGICHSDVHLHNGGFDLGNGKVRKVDFELPLVLGHEIVGEVYSLGSEVDSGRHGVSRGDKVMVYPWPGCGKCGRCAAGNDVLCPTASVYQIGCFLDGGYQEYVTVDRANCLQKVPQNISLDVAALLPCSGITSYHAIMLTKPVIEEFISCYGYGNLLIVGAGGLGLWGIQMAKSLFPKETRIIVAEASESKFAAAREAGADVTLLWDPKASIEENVATTKDQVGLIHAAVDFVNSTSTSRTLFGTLALGSKMVPVGLYGGQLVAECPHLTLGCITIEGSKMGTRDDLREVTRLVAEGKLRAPPITHVTLTKAPGVLSDLAEGKRPGRTVIKF